MTAATAGAFVAGVAGVSVLARQHDVSVRVLDLGVDADLTDLPTDSGGVQDPAIIGGHRPRGRPDRGRDRASAGRRAAIAAEEIAAGADLLILGDMGIGNTTPAAALIAATFAVPADEVTGRGTGIDDTALTAKTELIQRALDRAGTRVADPVTRLAALGSADIAAGVGFLVAAARAGIPVLLDGIVALAEASVAEDLAPGCVTWWAAGHRSTEPAQQLATEKLGLVPLLDLGLRLGEGSGASPRCRWSGRQPCCCRTWRCSPTSRELGVGLAAGGRHADGHPGPPAGVVDRTVAGRAMALAPVAVLPLAVVAAGLGWLAGPRAGRRCWPVWWWSPCSLSAPAPCTWTAWRTRWTVSAPAGTANATGDHASGRRGPDGGDRAAARARWSGRRGVGARHRCRGCCAAAVLIAASRTSLVVGCSAGVPAARPGGLGATVAGSVTPLVLVGSWVLAGAVVVILAVLAGVAWWIGLLAIVLGATVAYGVVRLAVRRLGGITGDVLGATVELTLLAMLLTATVVA